MDAVLYLLIGCCLFGIHEARWPSLLAEDVIARMDELNPSNCNSSHVSLEWYGTVSDPPVYHGDPDVVQQKNRSSLQYAHNTAANRGLFFSMVYSWQNNSNQFSSQPGLNYLYMSEAANVLAGPDGVVSSGLFFMPHRAYPNWLSTVSFNRTLPLFAARATRERGGNLATIKDLGGTLSTNYTNRQVYRQNKFFWDIFEHTRYRRNRPWEMDYDARYFVHYTVHRHLSDQSVNTFHFYAPWASSDLQYQAKVFPAVFDCGQTNQWIVPLAAPAAEFLPRYSWYTHLRSLKVIAASTVGVLYDTIDINQCPLSGGNQQPNPFAGLAQCPVECKVLPGHGLSSQGVQCCSQTGCSINRRISSSEFIRGQGELASVNQSDCPPNSPPTDLRELSTDFWDLNDIKAVFEVQGRAGLRLAHFLSNFLQNNDPGDNQRNVDYISRMWDEEFERVNRLREEQHRLNPGRPVYINVEEPQLDSPMRRIKVDQQLNRTWLEAEVFSTVMVDGQILSAGIFLEPGVFQNSEQPVSALSWRSQLPPENLRADYVLQGNVADVVQLGEDFRTENFYTRARQEYGTNNGSPSVFRTRSSVRLGDPNAPIVEDVPGEVTYTSVNFEDGQWLPPHFRCDPRVAQWIVSYVSPIFTKSSTGDGVVFGGVVKVDAYYTENHLFSTSQ